MIEFRDISVQKERFILKDITLTIPKGSSYAILGASGAGKSTLAKVLLGLQQPTSGRVFYKSKDITSKAVAKRGFAYVPQNLALFPHLNVQENLLFNQKNKDSYFDELVAIANIAHLLERSINTLSGGEKQRVALVRALLTKAEVLILDEPFSALDMSLKKELWIMLKKLQKKLNITTLLITHNLNEAYFLSDRVSIMQEGTIVETNTTQKLFSSPQYVQSAQYLGMKNIFSCSIVDSNKIFIEAFHSSYTLEHPLDKNYTHIVIKAEDILFAQKESANTLEGDYELLEFQEYAIALFKLKNQPVTLEIKLTKGQKPSSYIVINPKKFILLQTFIPKKLG